MTMANLRPPPIDATPTKRWTLISDPGFTTSVACPLSAITTWLSKADRQLTAPALTLDLPETPTKAAVRGKRCPTPIFCHAVSHEIAH